MGTVTTKQGDDFSINLYVTNVETSGAIQAANDLATTMAADPVSTVDVQNALDTYNAAILVDITNWTIESEMRWCGTLTQAFTVTKPGSPLNLFTLSALSADTQGWSPRSYDCDVEFTVPGEGVRSTNTFKIVVQEDVTNHAG